MSIAVVEKAGDVRVYGSGSPGGKGAGLIKINELSIPKVGKLRTRILTTDFYDHYRQNAGTFGDEERLVVSSILEELGDIPLGIRSSATNEAGRTTGSFSPIHAGENATFMLPNNHPDRAVRVSQAVQAIGYIYEDFQRRQPASSPERMGIVINPIPGLFDDTLAGPVYYPYISGVASSFFPHALKNQDPKEGFGRIAFGHGYATVLDDFPVISMATIRNPIPLNLLRIGNGQQYFYALDMTKNTDLKGEELETMKKLHVRFANYHKIRILGIQRNVITIEELVQKDHFGFRTTLAEIMETIGRCISSHFQIEFVFNLDFSRKENREGTFHIVQLTELPELKFDAIPAPRSVRRTYLSIPNSQGHGVTRNIEHAVVVSPFIYTKDMQKAIREKISQVNRDMQARGERYILIVPGRLGSKNPDWGIYVDYKDVEQAAAIFEYGVDAAGRAEPLPEEGSLTGGIYGSHFLYMIQGGFDEEQKRLATRMYGTQGTHFLTNLMSNNIIYGYVTPQRDTFDPWFFSSPNPGVGLSVLRFPNPVSVYADSLKQSCSVVAEND
ncbi:MAG: hypothetical protein A2V76_04525 [Candidatus Aminicenantes bacterium RBG_16_63_14]|nr:MAG: hypothetical protein A2V76_04525 [Candidatus Aminicenantes bacterium RBG_16_63_14]